MINFNMLKLMLLRIDLKKKGNSRAVAVDYKGLTDEEKHEYVGEAVGMKKEVMKVTKEHFSALIGIVDNRAFGIRRHSGCRVKSDILKIYESLNKGIEVR
ncbi:hypothetical protein Tco_0697026 [Tanacetum coccineum]